MDDSDPIYLPPSEPTCVQRLGDLSAFAFDDNLQVRARITKILEGAARKDAWAAVVRSMRARGDIDMAPVCLIATEYRENGTTRTVMERLEEDGAMAVNEPASSMWERWRYQSSNGELCYLRPYRQVFEHALEIARSQYPLLYTPSLPGTFGPYIEDAQLYYLEPLDHIKRSLSKPSPGIAETMGPDPHDAMGGWGQHYREPNGRYGSPASHDDHD